MPVRIVLLPGVALLPLLIVIMPTMSSFLADGLFHHRRRVAALIIPTHVLIEEVIREVWLSVQLLHRGNFVAFGNLYMLLRDSSPLSHRDLLFSRSDFIFACVDHGNHTLELVLVDIWVTLTASVPFWTEFGGSDVYQPKADPVRDREKYLTRSSSDAEIMPNCAKFRLTCSMELEPSDPLNFVKSGSRYLGGSGINSYSLGYGLV
ncbi:hypothetical protein QYE76_047227 [Lolium multiflorum]|uniref:Uncharacterized protein n=1 Tax=Lolium multiflorum TaxID=4521 RepID=A0AAD8TNF7_LOLMU|nr:hypothetical protein QYE76_047227 [Lolium multiflorum]